MMRALLAKELRQHQLLLLFLILLSGAGMALISGNRLMRNAGGSVFFSVRFALTSLIPLACVALSHALVANEFRHKTQLFLEGLPLPRWRMLLVKYLLGLGVMLVMVLIILAVAWSSAPGTEGMTPRFATLLVLKSVAWASCFYPLCFAHAFLGRYRIAFAAILLFGLKSLNDLGVEIARFGPFQLVDAKFPYERVHFPVDALLTTFGVALLLSALGFSLGLVRDATVASVLAEKMSAREKLFMGFLVFAVIGLNTSLLGHVRSATPVELPGAIDAQEGAARVYATAAVDVPLANETELLAKLARETAHDLAELAAYLRCDSLPPLFIVHRRDLKPNEFHYGSLQFSQGLMVKVNLTAPEFEPKKLRAWIHARILYVRTRGLATRERNAWVFDGFVEWWSKRKGTPDHEKDWPAVHATARQVMPADFSSKELDRWFSLYQQIGEDNAEALAAAGLASLAEQHGDEACRTFLSEFFSRDYPEDVRGWLRDVSNPPSRRLKKAAHISLEQFVEIWRESLIQPRQ
ncbi:MAG: hypothetical protein V4710_24935 [Verrucomicrobiota bacterium]